MEYSLKCNYSEGMFSHERFIKFKVVNPTQQNWCFVNKEDVMPSKIDTEEVEDGKKGLVKVVIKSLKEGKFLVGINDVADKRESRFYVPKEEVCTPWIDIIN